MKQLLWLTVVQTLLIALAPAGGVLFFKVSRRRGLRASAAAQLPAVGVAVAALIACTALWMAGGGRI